MKYDKHHIKKIIDALADGQGRVRACKIAGIDYQTFLNWIELHIEFFEQIKKAESIGNDKIKDICKRRIIENTTWQSAAWWLERNFPDEYKMKTEQINKNTNTEKINITYEDIHEADK